ncbi:MAG: 50S ribosomal protein L11 methyltransferase [Chloroflexota bacterium]|nr:50S ribosomal protein L11 methyltransferase [Chloroflexota bacterium]
MNWIEISVVCDGEAAEAVSELFNRYNKTQGGDDNQTVVEIGGFDSVGQLTDPRVTVKTYLPDDDSGWATCHEIERGVYFLGRIYPVQEPLVRKLLEADWATAWQKHYKPLRVGERLLILPAWQADPLPESDADQEPLLPIILDPGMAFGTGLHPSSRLCLAALERTLEPGDALLDVGCGSGILSIGAARLGASSILATDTDPIAVTATFENCRRNGVDHLVTARVGSLPDPLERVDGWPVIVVNILAGVIVGLLDAGLAQLLAENGKLILSGIIEDQSDTVVSALVHHGLSVCERQQEGDWMAFVAGRTACNPEAG